MGDQIWDVLVLAWPAAKGVLIWLGSMVVVGQGVVALTPTKKDDEAWEKIKAVPILGSLISGLTNFGIFQKK